MFITTIPNGLIDVKCLFINIIYIANFEMKLEFQCELIEINGLKTHHLLRSTEIQNKKMLRVCTQR